MKKRLSFFCTAIAVFLLTLVSGQVNAGHLMWTELTYNAASPNVYVVQLKVYRDCLGVGMPASVPLSMKAPGCNTGRTVTLQKNATTRIGNMYCASQPNGCLSTGLPNFEETIYSGIVTFSANEQSCSDWIFSWVECCRVNTTNILNGASEGMYTEARLKLLPGLVNNSPQISPIISNQVVYNEPVQLSGFALDPDGDSLVYSIQNPLRDANTMVSYANYPAMIIYNSDSSKYSPLTSGTFSNAFPIISYTVDWSKPMPLFPVKNFSFNSKNGSFSFIPRRLVKNIPANAPDNKYTLVVQLDEYRKVNGVVMKIGSVRKDYYLQVINGFGNKNPRVITPTANGLAISETDLIRLRPGIPLNFQFATSDSNTTDVISLSTDAADVLTGAVFTKTTGNQPTGTLTWTPTAAHIRDQVYYFHVLVIDDACPVKAHQIYTFGVKVTANGSVTGTSEMLADQVSFSAFPNPFSEEITFNVNAGTKAENIVIYNLLGQKVDEIHLKTLGLGEQKVQWQNAGKHAAGTYVARLVSGNRTLMAIKFTRLQ